MSSVIDRRSVLAGFALLGLRACAGNSATGTVMVAAASDLQYAIAEVIALFGKETGIDVRLSLGSTGNFARQIREGAPFELFMTADESFIFDLARLGLARDQGALYGIGRIVVKVPGGSVLAADGTLESLRAALAQGRIRRFAIANPEHAPYGKRAEEALRHAGLWDAIQPFLVMGENVAQVAQFALSGNADGGIIAYSLALAPDLAARGTHALIPENWHQPLRQRMALLRGAGPEAETFYRFIQTPSARAIMQRYGFSVPTG
ncbi:MAG: molybdate ABC transporter substrate-binding protein [Alphaproteobacteria bacterium]|nr:molybdate ABC transporter substrate-binding protein [Alphaproteobacteria bacterium]